MKFFGIPYTTRQVYYLLGDLLMALASIVIAHLVRFGTTVDPTDLARIPAASLFFLSTSLTVLYIADAYNPGLDFRRPQQIIRLWLAVSATLVLQVAVYFLFPAAWWGRGIAGLTTLSFGVLLTAGRALICWLRPRPVFRQRTLLVGDGDAEHILADVIRADPERGQDYDVIGCLTYPRYGHRRRNDDTPAGILAAPVPPGVKVLGSMIDLQRVIKEYRIDLIIVAIRGGMSSGMAGRLLAAKALGVQVEEMPTVYKRLTGKVPILHLSDSWLLFGPVFYGTSRLAATVERIVDIGLSVVGLALSAPFVAVAAVAVKLESPGPAFFLQERLGRNEVPFNIIKLRTMRQDAEAKTGAVWSAGSGDPRVTRVGRILRRSRIDELPQFWNVLRGDMAIVGPRPEREHFVRQLKESIPFYGLRFSVKPGVSGWAQVNFRYGASTEESAEKLCYELFAIQEMSPVLYGLIVLKTVQTMLLRSGS